MALEERLDVVLLVALFSMCFTSFMLVLWRGRHRVIQSRKRKKQEALCLRFLLMKGEGKDAEFLF